MKIICTTLNAKYIHTNIAIRYLKAYAKPEFDVEIVEFTIKDPIINIVTDLIQRKPEVIGFSCYIWNIEETLKVIKMIKKINSSIRIVLGGPEVTYDVYEWMEGETDIDFIVIGEGEETFKQLLHQLNHNHDFSQVMGIAYREGERIRITPQSNKVDLRELHHLFDLKRIFPIYRKELLI